MREPTQKEIEAAAKAMTTVWSGAPEGTPDWVYHYEKHKRQYMMQAKAAIIAASIVRQGNHEAG